MKEKVFLRREMRTKLRAQSPEQRAAHSLQIQKQLTALLEDLENKDGAKEWNEVALFLAQPSEPNLDAWAIKLQRKKIRVYAPHSEVGAQPFREIAPDWSNVHTNALGWREPQEAPRCALKTAREADAILLPGLAFDRKGARLGQGAGWYDRILEALPPQVLRVGICFDFQVVKDLPCADHDESVALIVTEKQVIYV